MFLFLKRLTIFLFIALVVVESFIRINKLTIDVPERSINNQGIQLYLPNQTGHWSNGAHKWKINKEGWPGDLPVNFEDLITLIGDSHIENFMNPGGCSMATLMNEKNKKYNFFEAGRSGVSLIEAIEISVFLDEKYSPKKQFIFLKDSDFKESIYELGVQKDITQVSLENNKVIHGQLKSPGLKKILYNFKTLYYFRNEFIKLLSVNNGNKKEKNLVEIRAKEKRVIKYSEELIKYIKVNYDLEKVVFMLHPESSNEYEKILENNNIKYYRFKTDRPGKWRASPNDTAHWNCFGFKKASDQLNGIILNEKS
jgi:hypothetical protein